MKTKTVKPKIPIYQFQINEILRRFRFPELKVLSSRPWLKAWAYTAEDGRCLVLYDWTPEKSLIRIMDKKTNSIVADLDNPTRKQITAAMRSELRREPEAAAGFGKQMSIDDVLMDRAEAKNGAKEN